MRCRALQQRVLARAGFRGTLAFTLPEALWLAEQRRARTCSSPIRPPIAARCARSPRWPPAARTVTVMVDSVEQLELIERAAGAPASAPVRVCLDLDAGWRAARRARARRRQALAACTPPRRPPRSPARSSPATGCELVGDHGLRGADRRARRRARRDARCARARSALMQARSARELARGAARDRGGGRGRARRRRRAALRVRQRRRHRQPRAHRARARRHRARGRLGPVRADAVRRLPRLHAPPGRAVRAAGRAPPGAAASSPRSAAATSPPGPADAARLPRPHLPARAAPRPPGGRRRGADAAARCGRRRAWRSATACTCATPRPASCASASRACTCSRASGSSRRCRPTAARDNASCERRAISRTTRRARCRPSCARSSRRSPRSTARPARPASGRPPSGWPRGCGSIAGVAVELEDEPSWGTFPPTATGLGLLGVAAAALVLARQARGPARCSRAAALRGHRRRGPERAAHRCGGSCAGGAAPSTWSPACARLTAPAPTAGDGGTLVVLAHHDAPQTGLLFDQTLQRRLHELAPRLLERCKTPPPQWWIGLAGPLCTIAGAPVRPPPAGPRRRSLIGALGTALVADVWRSETVPGANDNLSGVAALGRARRAAARASRRGPARAARLLRRRGDAAGRGARVHRAPPRTSSTRSAPGSSTSTRSARRTW